MAGTEPLLIGIDSLIMKCGICGSQIMVLILARDTTHWAVRVLSSSSVFLPKTEPQTGSLEASSVSAAKASEMTGSGEVVV